MMTKYKSSILLSRFKRLGGEGEFTQIVKDTNINSLGYELQEDEEALIYCNLGEEDTLLITNARVISNEFTILLSDLFSIDIMIREEMENGVKDKNLYTLLDLTDFKEKKYMVKIEAGKPFWGIFQTLFYVASLNHV